MKPEEKLSAILAKHGYKTTNVRQNVYAVLLDSNAPVSNTELIKLATNVDKVSVYRTVALFEELGIIHRIWNGFKSKVELDENLSPHHHHFSCNECGHVLSFDDDDLEAAIEKVESKLSVSVKRHLIELSGICKNCAVNNGAK